jgi:hypothetical protein
MANRKTRSQAQRARTRDRRSDEERAHELEYLRAKHGRSEGQAAFETAIGMRGYAGSNAEKEDAEPVTDEDRIAYWKGAYERMAARNKDLDAALTEIRDRHIPDQPAAYGGSEYDWVVRQYRELRSIATAAFALVEDTEDRKMTHTHTPTPWEAIEVRTQCGRAFRIGAGEMLKAGEGACIIYDDYPGNPDNERSANAALIVHAVNSLPALVKALEAILDYATLDDVLSDATKHDDSVFGIRLGDLRAARAALASRKTGAGQ